MAEELHEECGLAAVSLPGRDLNQKAGGLVYYLYEMLLQQQNRGQLSAGITTYSENRPKLLETFKDVGRVNEVFRASHAGKFDSIMKKYSGNRGIGHVRYATCGADDRDYAMPFERLHGRKWKWFSIAFNGNLANFSELKQELARENYHLIRNVDSEVIMHYLSKEYVGYQKSSFEDAFGNLANLFDGAYNLMYLNAEGTMIALRDPIGFRPLCYSEHDGRLFSASESSGLLQTDGEKFSDIEPGEMLIASGSGIEKKRFAKSNRIAHCMFEWVYFANVSSVMDKIAVYEARTELGKRLAGLETEKPDTDSIVVPVPDTATPAGNGFAFELGVPMAEGLIRNRYVGRTFIESSRRDEKVRDKYTLLKSVLQGKKVFLVEDSIVRGTTTAGLVKRIKEEGKAKEVHVRVSCPAILFPCFYGIDMSTMTELIAPRHCQQENNEISGKESEKIAEEIGADSLVYQSIDRLAKSIGLPKSELCTACLDGEYPTECGMALKQKAIENQQAYCKKRTYE